MFYKLGVFLFASAAFAQNGSISGVIRTVAGAGAAVPKAEVRVKNTSTGASFSAQSGTDGSYTASGLPAGEYEVSVELQPLFIPFHQDKVEVQPGKATRFDVRLSDVTLNTLGDGGVEFAYLMADKPAPTGPTPRTREGKPDLSGIWLPVLPAPLGETAQLTPWAEAAVKQRAGKDAIPPQTRCLPLGLSFSGLFTEYRIMQSPALIAIIEGDGDPARQIYLDGRGHPADPNPSFMGHSVGRWEGDTLVVDTVGLNDRGWLTLSGYPQSERLRVTERYRRTDLGHLEVEITYEDPTAFKKPWSTKQVHSLASKDLEMLEYVCTENNRDLEHLK